MFYCGKKLGYFDFSIEFFKGSNHIACQSCRDFFLNQLALLEHSTCNEELNENYLNTIQKIRQYQFVSVDSAIIDFNTYCKDKYAGQLDDQISQYDDYIKYKKDKEESRKKEKERLQHLSAMEAEQEEERIQALNHQYEYTSYYLFDSRSGIIEQSQLNQVLQRYAEKGWRLVSVSSNELGKNAAALGINGVTFGTNSTIDVMILIFERLKKPAATKRGG